MIHMKSSMLMSKLQSWELLQVTKSNNPVFERKNQSSCNFLKRTRKLNAPSKDIPSPSQSFEAAWLCCSVTSWLATWKTHRSQNPPTFLRPCCRGFVDARRLPALLYPKGDPNDPNDLILILLKIGTMIIRFLSEKDIILLSQ